MPVFKFHLRRPSAVEPDDTGIEFDDLHHAYLGACAAIPDTARDLLIAGHDPMACAYVICDEKGRRLMEVPFTELLSPADGAPGAPAPGPTAVSGRTGRGTSWR